MLERDKAIPKQYEAFINSTSWTLKDKSTEIITSMKKDQKLLEEAYKAVYESSVQPLYFGPADKKEAFFKWLKKLNHEVHEDGSVSIDGDVSFARNEFGQLGMFNSLGRYIVDRLPFNFQKVTGSFWCPDRIHSLEGSPEYVGKDFGCGSNNLNLISLEHSPKFVGGDFMCTSIRFDSLEGAPEVIKGEFDSDQFSDEDYRTFVKNRKYVEGKLDKDLDVDLEDFS